MGTVLLLAACASPPGELAATPLQKAAQSAPATPPLTPALPVRFRVFFDSQASGVAFAACPAGSQAIAGGCSCSATSGDSDVQLVEASLVLVGAGGYVCACAAHVPPPPPPPAFPGTGLTTTAQVTCVD